MGYPNYRRIRYLPNRSHDSISRGAPIAVVDEEEKTRRGSAVSAGTRRKASKRRVSRKGKRSKPSRTRKSSKASFRRKPRRVSKSAQRIWSKVTPLGAFSDKAGKELVAAHQRIIVHRGTTKKGKRKPVAIALSRLALEPEVVRGEHDIRGSQKLRTHRRVKDVVFTMDARGALKRANLPITRKQGRGFPFYQDIRRMVRHPQHLSKKAYPGWTGREWKEFSGLNPSFVAEFDNTALQGSFPGVRIESIEGTTADSRRRIVIDGSSKPLYLVWSNGGRRFMLTGSAGAMRELALDYAKVGEPIRLRVVNYFAPRYPVPRGQRRTYANTRKGAIGEMGISFTHKVESEVYLLWNGETNSKKALFWLEIKGRTKRHVNRSGITF